MTDAEKLRRDIEGKLESIRSAWIEAAKNLSPSERAEFRRSLELLLDDLKDLISK
jgi:hypothetical protein